MTIFLSSPASIDSGWASPRRCVSSLTFRVVNAILVALQVVNSHVSHCVLHVSTPLTKKQVVSLLSENKALFVVGRRLSDKSQSPMVAGLGL